MATIEQLESDGLLVKVEIELDHDEQPQRLIYAAPKVINWMENVLPGLQTDGYIPGANRPFDQVEALFYDVISGKAGFEMPPHCMEPEQDGVWELRTHDVRFFGFFWRKGIFVATSVDTKARCIKHRLYAGYRAEVTLRRGQLDLDPPTFVSGRDIANVL